MNRFKVAAILIVLLAFFLSLGSDRAFGYPPFLKQAKELGFEAKNCTYCHQTPKGGKGWNERGLWLKDQKKERKAPVVDVKWLKDFQPSESCKASDSKQ